MAYSTTDIGTYISARELLTLNYLFGTQTPAVGDDSKPPIYGIAGGNCLWGRYARLPNAAEESAGTPRTACVPKYGGDDGVKLIETYACTGYGSPQALLGMVKRHDHTQGKAFMCRWAKHYMDMCHWNLDKHGIPPGEYNRHEPHSARNSRETSLSFPDGDSDIHRHHDAFGHFQTLCDSDMKALGGWTTSDVLNLASKLENYYIKSFQGVAGSGTSGNKHIREYHRIGNRLNSIAGIYDAYKTYNKPADAERILQLAASLVLLYYQDGWSIEYAGNLATSTFTIWNYGDFLGGVKPPEGNAFLFTHYRYGSQPWYDGHQMLGLWNLGLRFDAANYATTTSYTETVSITNASDVAVDETGNYPYDYAEKSSTRFTSASNVYDAAFQKCVQVINETTKWYDEEDRVFAPLGDWTGYDSQDFVNAKLQGMKNDDVEIEFLGNTCTTDILTSGDWNSLADDAEYYRWWVTDCHESDGKYHHVFETDTNGANFARKHYPRNWYRQDVNGDPIAAYNTGGSAYGVKNRMEITNAYLVPDMAWMRATILNDNSKRDFARILMFDYWAHAYHPSTIKVKKEDMFSTATGWGEQDYYAAIYNNWWHWTMQCGHLIRDADLGTGS